MIKLTPSVFCFGVHVVCLFRFIELENLIIGSGVAFRNLQQAVKQTTNPKTSGEECYSILYDFVYFLGVRKCFGRKQ